MEGAHDLGGLDGFGPVVTPDGELAHHDDFEIRAQALAVLAVKGTFRPWIEQLPPATYLSSSYYERWERAVERAVVERATIGADDLARWQAAFAADPDRAVPARDDAEQRGYVDQLMTSVERLGPAVEPRFAVGDAVRVRRRRDLAHHRCPRYVRGALGTIEHVCGQARVAGQRGRWAPLYTVAFRGEELWGGDAEPGCTVLVDLSEDYLDDAREHR